MRGDFTETEMGWAVTTWTSEQSGGKFTASLQSLSAHSVRRGQVYLLVQHNHEDIHLQLVISHKTASESPQT